MVNYAVEKALENLLPALLDKAIKRTIADGVVAPIVQGFACHEAQIKEGFSHHEKELRKAFKWLKDCFELFQAKMANDESETATPERHRMNK
jgi:hypothetical protein